MRAFNLLKATAVASVLSVLAAPLHAMTLIGSWDLREIGVKDDVYRDGQVLKISQGGQMQSFTINNSAWEVSGVADTNGIRGKELVIKAGPELIIVDVTNRTRQPYLMGNISWAVMKVMDFDKAPGDEVLLSIGAGVTIVKDATRNRRDIRFNYTHSWALYDVVDLSGAGPEIILNMGDGVKIIDPRTGRTRDERFDGYSAIFSIGEFDGLPGKEILGRAPDGVYLIEGGVAGYMTQRYRVSSSLAWAIYGRTVDLDGKPGDEIILIKQNEIFVIRRASRTERGYSIQGTYSVDSVADMDGQPGAEILLRNSYNKRYLITDRLNEIRQF